MWTRVILLALLCLPMPGQMEALIEEFGVVRLKLAWGPPVQASEIAIFDNGRPVRIEWLGYEGEFARFRVPYGEYRLHLRVAGFVAQESEMRVSTRETTVRRHLDSGSIGLGRDRIQIAGRAILPPGNEAVWVKLLSLDGPHADETQATERGFFAFGDLPRANYLVVVLRGEDLVVTKKVEARGSLATYFAAELKP